MGVSSSIQDVILLSSYLLLQVQEMQNHPLTGSKNHVVWVTRQDYTISIYGSLNFYLQKKTPVGRSPQVGRD